MVCKSRPMCRFQLAKKEANGAREIERQQASFPLRLHVPRIRVALTSSENATYSKLHAQPGRSSFRCCGSSTHDGLMIFRILLRLFAALTLLQLGDASCEIDSHGTAVCLGLRDLVNTTATSAVVIDCVRDSRNLSFPLLRNLSMLCTDTQLFPSFTKTFSKLQFFSLPNCKIQTLLWQDIFTETLINADLHNCPITCNCSNQWMMHGSDFRRIENPSSLKGCALSCPRGALTVDTPILTVSEGSNVTINVDVNNASLVGSLNQRQYFTWAFSKERHNHSESITTERLTLDLTNVSEKDMGVIGVRCWHCRDYLTTKIQVGYHEISLSRPRVRRLLPAPVSKVTLDDSLSAVRLCFCYEWRCLQKHGYCLLQCPIQTFSWFMDHLTGPVTFTVCTERNCTEFQSELRHLLHQGAFGEVYCGSWEKLGERTVAIKSIPLADEEIEKEALVLSRLEHPNIVRLYGMTRERENLLLVFEMMELGDLRTYLRARTPQFSNYSQFPPALLVEELKKIVRDIASGLCYLVAQQVVHRDLAARNCLVTGATDIRTSNPMNRPPFTVKISDFGMSRRLYGDSDYYRMEHHSLLPVRWLPPEAINDHKFNHMSDIWSFGVTIWEVFSYGQVPFSELSNHEVVSYAVAGLRPAKPKNCPEDVYDLMVKCWNGVPEHRSTAEDILLDPCFQPITPPEPSPTVIV
ncbi:unnamed protein product [Caenorhabditis auriculariae]|uniref:Protein kinase domain-containing protein n=1 Tax=Caenorhabditis auriculariae TaxID=2777116 RepID=A0A8S1H1L6_9PELO|nr:unnamed protein product [Caenorhabditis auriculariae]